MGKRFRLNQINEIPSRILFFDTNVLMYIFFPELSVFPWSKSYSSFLKQSLSMQFKLALDITVLSEIINSVLRIDYNNMKDSGSAPDTFTFKDYRNSSQGKQNLSYIHTVILKQILPCFEVLDIQFSESDLHKLLVTDSIDFNDKIIASLCRKHDCILVTNDRDFASVDIDIISSNPKLIQT